MSSQVSRIVHVMAAGAFVFICAAAPVYGQVEQVAILQPDPLQSHFGSPVAISGDYIVVGAQSDNKGGPLAGAAYVFKRDNGGWSEHAKLLASDASMNGHFGSSVAIDGDRIAIGAPQFDPLQSHQPGKAYIFRRDGASWIEEAILIPSGSHESDDFGWSVSLDGDRVVVGAPLAPVSDVRQGKTYIFRREGTEWVEEAALIASDSEAGDFFGHSVSLQGELLVVGAWGDDDECPEFITCDSGAAYVFRRDNGTWVQEARLKAGDAAQGDRFGRVVSLSGEYVLIGAPKANNVGFDSGAAYLFRRRGPGDWIENAELIASDEDAFDEFGGSVSIDGNLALIGAWANDGACPEDPQCNSGSAYLFLRIGSTWREILFFEALTPLANSGFGVSVSLAGEDAVIGSGERSYVFKIDRPEDRIPAVSIWGLLLLGLILLVSARIHLRHGRYRQA